MRGARMVSRAPATPPRRMDLLLRPLESLLVDARRLEPRFPPTFVIGAPRGGTTLVGLHLARAFRWSYFPNVAKRHRKTPFLATRRALASGERWEPSYDNRYGQAEGDLAPSDGWDVLLRWFGGYREATAAEAPGARGLKTLVRRLEDLFDAPFLCKNNQNTMRIGALAALFDRALFVLVTRALPEAVASLLEARATHGVALNEWWSAAPPQYLERRFESELEQVVHTQVGLERYAREQLARAAPDRHLVLDYADFCARPGELLGWVEEAYRARGARLLASGAELPQRFDASRLEAGERAALERRMEPVLARLGADAPAASRGSNEPGASGSPGAPR